MSLCVWQVTVEKRDQGENVEIRSLEEELFWIQMLIGVVFFIIINYYCFFFSFRKKITWREKHSGDCQGE